MFRLLTPTFLIGITRASNDPEAHDVEKQTSEMIRKYVEAESRVIVCALPANVDFSNSGALKIALHLDKEGKRTLGVVTKIDTYEKATQIKERLESTRVDEIRLKLGYVAVRCRNQMELQNGMSLDELHAVEKELLTTDDELKHIREDLKGTPVLINKLIEIQRNRLREKVPELIKKVGSCYQLSCSLIITSKVESAIVDRARELDKLKAIPESPEDCFLQIIIAANALSAKYQEAGSIDHCQDNTLDIRHMIYSSLEVFRSDVSFSYRDICMSVS